MWALLAGERLWASRSFGNRATRVYPTTTRGRVALSGWCGYRCLHSSVSTISLPASRRRAAVARIAYHMGFPPGLPGPRYGPTVDMRKPAASRGPDRPHHEARERAKRLLVHRANGGIHNAAIALRLVTSDVPSVRGPTTDTTSFVAAGIRGTADASRALQLLGALVGLESTSPPGDGNAFVDDIATMLNAESLRRGITIRIEVSDREHAGLAIPLERLAAMLVAGLSAVENAPPNSVLTIGTRPGASPSEMPWAIKVDAAKQRKR